VRKSGGSHVVFLHDDLEEALTVPAHRSIKPVYVRRLVKLIDKLEEEKDEEGDADGDDEN